MDMIKFISIEEKIIRTLKEIKEISHGKKISSCFFGWFR